MDTAPEQGRAPGPAARGTHPPNSAATAKGSPLLALGRSLAQLEGLDNGLGGLSVVGGGHGQGPTAFDAASRSPFTDSRAST